MAETGNAFVVGWPISHSLSPLIHNTWMNDLGITGSYIRQAVEPGHFGSFIENMAKNGFSGGNVTLPHKQAAFELADRKDDVATKLQAANTLWLKDGLLHATNTDPYGFAANLDDRAPGWDTKALNSGGSAIVLGAGGASRAVIYVLMQRGFQHIRVVNRTLSRAEELAAHFGMPVTAHEPFELPKLMKEAAFLVNTTSLGMKGQEDIQVDLAPLPRSALVTDIIYTPLETTLLRTARLRGLTTVDGLGMLLHQAVPGFELWFGKRPEVTPELRKRVVSELGKSQ